MEFMMYVYTVMVYIMPRFNDNNTFITNFHIEKPFILIHE